MRPEDRESRWGVGSGRARTGVAGRARGGAGRRGSVYVLVLGASLMVAAAGVAAVAVSRAGTRGAVLDRDWAEAGAAAGAGLELLVGQINATPAWRASLASGGTVGPVTIGRARVVMSVVDETDGNLADDPSQPVRLYASARVGGASRTQSVRASPASAVGLDCLRAAVHAAGGVTVAANATVVGGPLSSNQSVSNSAVLTGSVEAPSVSSTGFIDGTVRVTGAKTMPTDAGWAALGAAATALAWSSLPAGGAIDRAVLGPGVNTTGGARSARGVYAVTVPAGSTLTVRRSRMNCCLLVTLAAGARLVVADEVFWDAPEARLPSLLVQGAALSGVTLTPSSDQSLKESDAGRTLNPPGCPYNGVADADLTDTYPNAITGLVHLLSPTTTLTLGSNVRLGGCLITAGAVSVANSGNVLAAQPSLLTTPPIGYNDPSNTAVQMDAGTFRWEVSN